jgi:hypothetical protein
MQQDHFKTFSERAVTVGDDGVVAGHWVHCCRAPSTEERAHGGGDANKAEEAERRGGNPMEVRGGISMKLTIGSKTLATVFFVIEVQDNYSVILYRDWIHANHYVPSILH